MKNQWRMPKGYKNMDADTLAREILKNRSNREMIESAYVSNPREGIRYETYADVQKQLAKDISDYKNFKEKHGQNADNLEVVKSIQRSNIMKSQGERGGENILKGYERYYKQEWAAAHGYTYNPETGRTKDRQGHFVYNYGWDVVKEHYKINTDTMEYKKETKQYTFKGRGNKEYFLNTSATTFYDPERFAITQTPQNEMEEDESRRQSSFQTAFIKSLWDQYEKRINAPHRKKLRAERLAKKF
jgi:hypothetical protein